VRIRPSQGLPGPTHIHSTLILREQRSRRQCAVLGASPNIGFYLELTPKKLFLRGWHLCPLAGVEQCSSRPAAGFTSVMRMASAHQFVDTTPRWESWLSTGTARPRHEGHRDGVSLPAAAGLLAAATVTVS
jgi:hypothetical protein